MTKFVSTPLGAFVVDIIDAAVLGAAMAAIALPDSIGAKEALGLIIGATIGSVKGAARLFLIAYVRSKQT